MQEKLTILIPKALSSASTRRKLHKLHSLITTLGLAQTGFFSGKLIAKYAQLKDPVSSLSLFRTISPTKDVYQWNTIIRAMAQNELFDEALDQYSKMRVLNVKPDTYTFPSVINSCAGCKDFETAQLVHNHVLEMGFGSDLYICNALIDMYSRFCKLGSAREVFDGMPERDVVSWNSLISGCSSHGEWEEALELFYRARMGGLLPDSFMVSSVLSACRSLFALEEGQMVHGLIQKTGIEKDTRVCNALLWMYLTFGKIEECHRVFDGAVVRDTITWNTMICGYSEAGLYQEAVKLFMEMKSKFKPDYLTVTSVLRACSRIGDLKLGRYVHDFMISNGYECDVTANNILINMYVKCGCLSTAREIFNRMQDRDCASWNSLIGGYIQNGQYDEAMKIFKAMKMELEPDFVTHVSLLSMCTQLRNFHLAKALHCEIIKTGIDVSLAVRNAIIDSYAKSGDMEGCLKQFENMNDRDIITWNTITAACVHSEDCDVGFTMIRRMRVDGIMPDVATLLGTLPLCSMLAAKRQGKEIHSYILKMGFESKTPVANALIEMYSKCGSLRNSILIFENLTDKDVITWTALIHAYGMYGQGREAVLAFEDMKTAGIIPDEIAFVSIMFACSHSGLVNEGRNYFHQMRREYKIEPKIEHYACLVDLLARSGQLAEAEKVILSMPLKPDASIWGALLSACRTNGDTKIAERASEYIIQLNSNNTGYYILASNVYASLRKWDQVSIVRKSLRSKGLKKDAGCSWVEIRNKIYVFSAGDKFFEQYEEVGRLLEILMGMLAKEGYVANLKDVVHDVEEDEKKDMLCGHSERLAIAFGLLNTKPGTPLQIMKNLRVCGDCHTVTKYISKIVRRELLVRDANRFHLFKDGTCSCGDFW